MSVMAPCLATADSLPITIDAAITYGTTIRAQERSPELVTPGNGARVGVAGTARGGIDVDDGELNYGKGAHVSTSVNAFVDVELKYPAFRVFVRAEAWNDFAQNLDAVPHGSVVNGYAANSKLSDAGFNRYGKFSGVVLMDALVEANTRVADWPVMVSVGQQAIPWGRADTTLLGGLEQVNAIDYTARYRAGALAGKTGYVPVPSIFARVGTPETTAFEAFYLFKYHENEQPGCGTYFAPTDYSSPGCDKVFAQPITLSDPAALAAGIFATRAPDLKPPDSGQFGFGITHQDESLGRFGAYFANYHSRRLAPSALKSPRLAFGGTPLIPGDPGGENVRYFIDYPSDVRMLGLTYAAGIREGPKKGAGVYAEYTYRPNQSVALNPTDLLNAFASNVAPTPLRADATATAPGAMYHGYDRRKISQLNISARYPAGRIFGSAIELAGEAGLKYIHDLTDVNVRRYGRSDVFGPGPVDGVCVAGATPTQCTNDGYVTTFSWGYRLSATLQEVRAVEGVTLSPLIAFAHDVKGYSHDFIFIEGRRSGIVGVRGGFGPNFFVELKWWPNWGGTYNQGKDRDYYTAVAGVTF